MDFFNVPENRSAIIQREDNKCFYCLRLIDSSNYVIEHVISRPKGNNSYRNLVASCLNCNNRKGKLLAEDFIRVLYRNGYLNDIDFEQRLVNLQLLKSGELKPDI
jgi:5-methylcytosine-specific restriction endonuclease McrA